jgi:phenylacetic acid degradation operon negative regulatory protein
MVDAGEVAAADGWYQLAGALVTRQARQSEGRHPQLRPWSGSWQLHVVQAEPRPAAARADLRRAATALHLAELREGVWTRPDNLDPGRLPEARAVLADQCRAFESRPVPGDVAGLVAELWDLDAWARRAADLDAEMAGVVMRLDQGDTDALRPGWELAAAVLRHLLADPLLPPALLPAAWPGASLRATFEDYDDAFKRQWREFFRRT